MVKVLRKLNEIKDFRSKIQNEVGLVPTMGNLHNGHLSLIKESLKDNKTTIVTIFVNPKQFGPNEDFDLYPRTLEEDVEKVSKTFAPFSELGKTLVIFAPESNDEIYPANFSTSVTVSDITEMLCGASRPNHFDGVTTVVYRLFAITQATQAYFGQKDYQQYLVIKKMINDLDYPIRLNRVDIVRNTDGLALSSRNQYLKGQETTDALELPKTLVEIKKVLNENSWINSQEQINTILKKTINDSRWEYLEILDGDSLKDISMTSEKAIILGALKVGTTRLIDNQLVDLNYA